MKVCVASIGVALLGLGLWGCGGNGYSSNSGGSPAGPSSTGGNVVTVNVVGVNGSQSFSPNPTHLPAGQMVVWHNADTIRHRVVLNDHSVDTGILDPGASSTALHLLSVGPYHCTIHPEMVGTITY